MSNESLDFSLHFCVDTILKEARKEDKLVKQVVCVMLSAYTNNPLNLAINSPSGEGKNWVIQKVAEIFPKQDIVVLSGMTSKAIFHREGVFVVKNETGEYQGIDDKLADINSEIDDKGCEITRTSDIHLKEGLMSWIESLQKQKEDLRRNAKKLIDLSHKIVVFPDTPPPELLNALMSLLSHDRYEVEYEYVDTHNGIKTKCNVLRGWPAVIFAQAIDYSHYARYPEIQRRFIITNPRMDAEKYEQAIDLIGDKFGLPDFAYQQKVVSDYDKERARQVILELKEKMLNVNLGIAPGKNNVIIPFNDVLKISLPNEKAFDMTTANRLFGFLSLLPVVNFEKRPKLVLRKDGDVIPRIIPFALFEDLRETIFLMEYANGVRPYVLEWFHKVFLKAYDEKKEPNAKVNSRGETLVEKKIAITTEQLAEKTKDIYRKSLTTKKVLESYVYPLINEGYIDKTESDLDKRSYIFYPVTQTTTSAENRKLFQNEQSNNLSQKTTVVITNYSLFPGKNYLVSKLEEVLRYSSQSGFNQRSLLSDDGKEITVEELVDKYYNNPEDFFELRSVSIGSNRPEEKSESSGCGIVAAIPSHKGDGPSNIIPRDFTDEQIRKDEIASESQKSSTENLKSFAENDSLSNKLFENNNSNNFLYHCYHCTDFRSNNEDEFEKHTLMKHPGKPAYPSRADLERHRLKTHQKSWET